MGFAAPSGSADDELIWKAIAFFYFKTLPALQHAGAHVQWGIQGPAFGIIETTIPGATEDDVRAVYQPFTDYLENLDIPYQVNLTSFPNFYEHADRYIGPFPYGTFWASQIQGGAMISRSTAASNVTGPELLRQFRHIITTTKFAVLGYTADFSIKDASMPHNAVHPGWRDLLSYTIISQQWNYSIPFSDMDEQERLLTEEIMPPLQDFSDGAYLNEADFRNPRWRDEFYGSNWQRLSDIKRKWDPEGLLYAITAVGSEMWETDAHGRLCKV